MMRSHWYVVGWLLATTLQAAPTNSTPKITYDYRCEVTQWHFTQDGEDFEKSNTLPSQEQPTEDPDANLLRLVSGEAQARKTFGAELWFGFTMEVRKHPHPPIKGADLLWIRLLHAGTQKATQLTLPLGVPSFRLYYDAHHVEDRGKSPQEAPFEFIAFSIECTMNGLELPDILDLAPHQPHFDPFTIIWNDRALTPQYKILPDTEGRATSHSYNPKTGSKISFTSKPGTTPLFTHKFSKDRFSRHIFDLQTFPQDWASWRMEFFDFLVHPTTHQISGQSLPFFMYEIVRPVRSFDGIPSMYNFVAMGSPQHKPLRGGQESNRKRFRKKRVPKKRAAPVLDASLKASENLF